MQRRHLVAFAATLPAAALASHVFAQDSTAPAMGEAEETHAMETGRVGSLSLLQSRLAATNASHEKVTEFATWEVAEQETIGDILKSMMSDPTEAQGALQPPTDEEAQGMIDEAGQAKLAELEGLSGAEFDAAYVAANLEGHQQLLAIQEEYLTVGTNREHLSIAKLARGMITEHIAHLEALQAELG
jgi:putative membrane protein